MHAYVTFREIVMARGRPSRRCVYGEAYWSRRLAVTAFLS